LLSECDIPPHPSLSDREMIIRQHLSMEVDYAGEGPGSRNFRKHLLWYTKGLPGGAGFRNLISAFRDKDAILKELHGFFQACTGGRISLTSDG